MSKEKVSPAAICRPSRCAARSTKGRGGSASPLGPVSSRGENILRNEQSGSGQCAASGQCGTHTIFLRIFPSAPRRTLPAFPSGKNTCFSALKEKRNGQTRNSSISIFDLKAIWLGEHFCIDPAFSSLCARCYEDMNTLDVEYTIQEKRLNRGGIVLTV